jgi:ankyrin repeat protein
MYAKTAAVGSGDLSVLEALIAAGADVNARDVRGRTALDYVVERSERVISFLKAKGAQ